jgi:hypothetical protein
MVSNLKLASVVGTKKMLAVQVNDNGTCVSLQEKQHR